MKTKSVITRSLMELVYCLLSKQTERKTKQSKTYASYRLVQKRPFIVTGKIITSSNKLITSKVKFF